MVNLKTPTTLLGGSWDLVSKVISTLIGVISIVTLIMTLVTKSHDPLKVEPHDPSPKALVLKPETLPWSRSPPEA